MTTSIPMLYHQPMELRDGFVTLRWPDRRKGPYEAAIKFAEVGGRQEVVEVILGSVKDNLPITTTDVLRRVPLAELAAEAAGVLDHIGAWRSIHPGLPLNWAELDAATLARREVAFAGEIQAAERFRLGMAKAAGAQRHRYGPGDLALIAEIYRSAHRLRRPPTKAVAEALGISYAAAAKQVARARQGGYLRPTTQGKKR